MHRDPARPAGAGVAAKPSPGTADVERHADSDRYRVTREQRSALARLALLLVLVAANWLLWASAVPFGEAPDEPSHLEVAQLVAAEGRLPVFGPNADQYVRLDQVGIPIESHALAPPLPYLLDGALIHLLPLPPLASARLGSLLVALLAVALTYALVATLPLAGWAASRDSSTAPTMEMLAGSLPSTSPAVEVPAVAPGSPSPRARGEVRGEGRYIIPTSAVAASRRVSRGRQQEKRLAAPHPFAARPASPAGRGERAADPRRALALAVAALVAAVPEVSFLAAVVNSDIVALAAALLVGVLWPAVVRPSGALAFGLALGAALLAKYTVYPVAAAALLAALWQLWRARLALGGRALAIRGAVPALGGCALAMRGALVALGAALVAGPWLARNWALYGEPWPRGVAEAAFRALTPAVPVPGAPGSRVPLSAEYARSWWEITFRSFWAGFGRVDLFAPTWAYLAIVAALLLALAGLSRILCRPAGRATLAAALRQPAGALLVAWPLATLAAVFVASLGRYYPAHGRYLLPALPPLALGLALGWQAALAPRAGGSGSGVSDRGQTRASRVGTRLPRTAPWLPGATTVTSRAAPWLLVAAMAALNVYCLLAVVVPRYYGPGATRVVVTVDEPRPGGLADGAVRVRGWAVVSGRGAWTPGQIGGAPPWHAAAERVWLTLDDAPLSDAPGGSAPRPDLARALGTDVVAAAGFDYTWEPHGVAPGLHTLAVCAADPNAADAVCVPIPLRVGAP